MNDSPRSILRSAAHFFTGTMLSRISGLLRDISLAYAFGTQGSIAGFMLAFRFSHLFRRLLGEGPLQSALIPQIEEVKKESPERAAYFFRDLLACVSLILLAIIGLAVLGLGTAAYFGQLEEQNRKIVLWTALMMPSLFFICLFGINAALLQTSGRFFVTGAAPVMFNVVWIVGTALIFSYAIDTAMYGMCFFVIIACLGQWLITVPPTIKLLKQMGMAHLFGRINIWNKDLLLLWKPLSLGIVGVAASQVNNALDGLFARFAEPEGPAYLWYSIRLQQLPLALFGIAIANALLPALTRAIKQGNEGLYISFLKIAIKKSGLLLLPMTVAIMVLGTDAVKLVFGHGDFQNGSVMGTTECLIGYGIGLLPMGLILLFAPAFFAKNNYKTPTRGAVYSMLLNAGLNGFFVFGLSKGSESVAYATSISAWFNLIYLYRKLDVGLWDKDMIRELGVIFLGSVISGLVVYGYGEQVGNEGILRQVLLLGVKAGLFAACFGLVYFGCRWMIKAQLKPQSQ